MKRVLVALLAMGLGCGATSTPTPPATPPTAGSSVTAHPRTTPPGATVHGWWQVADDKSAADIRNAQLKLATTELAIVLPDGRVMVRECPVAITGATTGQISNCNGNATLSVSGDVLTFDAGARERFTATRISPDKIAALDATLAAKRPPADACARARRCYRAAMAALAVTPDEEGEFKHVQGASDCVATTKGLTMILDEKQLPIPNECKP